MDKIYLTWWQVDRAIFALADHLREYGPDVIVGVARGGLIPAVRLSHVLGDVEVRVIDVKFYKDIEERMERPVITIPLHGSLEGKRVVVVDDVSDTGGKTLEVVIDEVRKKGGERRQGRLPQHEALDEGRSRLLRLQDGQVGGLPPLGGVPGRC